MREVIGWTGCALVLVGLVTMVTLVIFADGELRAIWDDYRARRHLRRDIEHWDRLAEGDRKRRVT